MHPETRYKVCEFRENHKGCAPAGRYSTFWSNLNKNFSLGSHTLTVAPMWMKFGTGGPWVPSSVGTDEGTLGSFLRPKFHPIGATCRPCGVKNLKIGL